MGADVKLQLQKGDSVVFSQYGTSDVSRLALEWTRAPVGTFPSVGPAFRVWFCWAAGSYCRTRQADDCPYIVLPWRSAPTVATTL